MSRHIVVGLVLAVLALWLLADGRQSGRTLSSADLWSTSGGFPIADRCCSLVPGCGGTTTPCSTWNNNGPVCGASYDWTVFPGNNTGCISFAPNVTCTASAVLHDCTRTVKCFYNIMTGVCFPDPAGGSTITQAPDSCSPSC